MSPHPLKFILDKPELHFLLFFIFNIAATARFTDMLYNKRIRLFLTQKSHRFLAQALDILRLATTPSRRVCLHLPPGGSACMCHSSSAAHPDMITSSPASALYNQRLLHHYMGDLSSRSTES
ncbi:unnamed protein product [Boreogadus saida]